jgi:UrcA family protein
MTSITSGLRNFRRTAALTTLGALLIAASTGAAYAAAADDTVPAIKVAYSDLNLASAQGNSALYARIVSAARQVCNVEYVDGRDLRGFVAAQACEANAIARAVKSVPSPQLAALHGARLKQG